MFFLFFSEIFLRFLIRVLQWLLVYERLFMRIFIVYLLAFIGTSIIDALWNFVISGKMPIISFLGLLSQFLLVSAIMFIVLYKTKGRPKIMEAVLMGSIAGILAISVKAFENTFILEFIWGPVFGALSGFFIALLAKKLL